MPRSLDIPRADKPPSCQNTQPRVMCLRRSPRMTHLCSVRVTHTKNTICARLPVGKKARPAAVLLPIPLQPIHFSRTSSFFADVAHAARASSCPAAKVPPPLCGCGLLLASKIGSFLASAEDFERSKIPEPMACRQVRNGIDPYP